VYLADVDTNKIIYHYLWIDSCMLLMLLLKMMVSASVRLQQHRKLLNPLPSLTTFLKLLVAHLLDTGLYQ
jgi:hypothetical protein